ncbi:DUF6199 family natural product biosynthesis protein [Mycolicibacterium goodii]|uniref:DUF6199 family natural product biosynthesis protein n=1 Tax=Mycolicibacterium goodii TaxID=134601 RepID=UPI0006736CFF
MAVAILVLIVGIPGGLFILLRPRKLWWATESWKYRNPEANEPSDASYAMTSLSGLFVIGASILLAVLAWSAESDRKEHEAERKQRDEWKAAVEAYQPPAPEKRGTLPVIGYVSDPAAPQRPAEVYYLAPPGSGYLEVRNYAGKRGLAQCVTSVGARSADGAPAHLSVELLWAPDVPQKDSAASDKCTTRDIASTHEVRSDRIAVPQGAGLVTDSPIVDRDGNVLVPAGPANAVPKLDRPPR